MTARLRLRIALVLALAACGDHTRDKPEPAAEPQRTPRVIEPPGGVVRALPPHAIRAQSIGPYKLGQKLSEILEQLPSGPRLVLFEVPNLLHASVIRADDDAVLIGGEPQGTATFVAAVTPEVARTESGIHVGSTREELVTALGEPVEDLDHARDPRLVIPAQLRSARVVIDDSGKIGAIAIVGEPNGPASAPSGREDCPRPPSTDKAIGACLTGVGELVEVNDGEVIVRLPDSEKSMTRFPVPNAVYAVPLRAPDGRDELLVVTRNPEPALTSWSVVGFRVDNRTISRSVDPTPLYQLSSSSARWIGAEVHDVDLYLEFAAKGDSIEVGGLLTNRPSGGAIRDVVVISTVSVPRKHGKPPAEAVPADGAGAVREGSGSGSGIGIGSGSGSAGSDRAKP